LCLSETRSNRLCESSILVNEDLSSPFIPENIISQDILEFNIIKEGSFAACDLEKDALTLAARLQRSHFRAKVHKGDIISPKTISPWSDNSADIIQITWVGGGISLRESYNN
jgi:hypothetical protein